MLTHRDECSQTQPPSTWQGSQERMQTCPECNRSAPADENAPRRQNPNNLQVPPLPTSAHRTGWPTHRARRRNSRRRYNQENR